MNLVLLGAPGAGKGTQADIIKQKTGMYILSTGRLLREKARENTESGKKIAEILKTGALLSDETVIALVEEKLKSDECKKGVIFDGFPRTRRQAEILDELVEITAAIALEVKDEEIIERMGQRRICPTCQSSYHLKHLPPKRKGLCDKCDVTLVVREDDKPETVLARLKVYHEQTEPLMAHYATTSRFYEIDGTQEPSEISEEVLRILEAADDNR